MTDHNELVRQARGYEPDANGFVETSTEFLGRLADAIDSLVNRSRETWQTVMLEHADYVTHAEARCEKLAEALKPFADIAARIEADHPGWDHDAFVFRMANVTIGLAMFRAAREALKAAP